MFLVKNSSFVTSYVAVDVHTGALEKKIRLLLLEDRLSVRTCDATQTPSFRMLLPSVRTAGQAGFGTIDTMARVFSQHIERGMAGMTFIFKQSQQLWCLFRSVEAGT